MSLAVQSYSSIFKAVIGNSIALHSMTKYKPDCDAKFIYEYIYIYIFIIKYSKCIHGCDNLFRAPTADERSLAKLKIHVEEW